MQMVQICLYTKQNCLIFFRESTKHWIFSLKIKEEEIFCHSGFLFQTFKLNAAKVKFCHKFNLKGIITYLTLLLVQNWLKSYGLKYSCIPACILPTCNTIWSSKAVHVCQQCSKAMLVTNKTKFPLCFEIFPCFSDSNMLNLSIFDCMK